ncbi:MAG: adenosine kinase [Spirochaetaceae bacterium]|nr:MAG: adenosine kinase [Spirochaetaceae bacterium]
MICAMGNPLIDTILSGTREDLQAIGAAAGSMNLVEYDQQQEVVSRCAVRLRLAGGSAANTIRAVRWIARHIDSDAGAHFLREHGLAASSPTARYVGAVGRDDDGVAFETLLREETVEPVLAITPVPTGSSAIVVTPDSERTMFTYLGACRELRRSHLPRFAGVTLFHTTGYMWDTPNQQEAADCATKRAREAGAKISLDVADSFVVDRYRDALRSWIPGRVDVLFANRQELYSLTDTQSDRTAMDAAASLAPLVVMKVGAEGCLVGGDRTGALLQADGIRVSPLDTTGAGDSFAGGFLYGLVCGWDLRDCAEFANRIAASVVTVEGCDYGQLSPELVFGS